MEVPFGKYQGISVNHVVQMDLLYCKWILEKSDIPKKEKFNEFVIELRKEVENAPKHDDSDLVMGFGEYRGMTIDEFIDDKEYCEWLLVQNSFREEYPTIHKELSKLFDFHYSHNIDETSASFYILFFKDRDYIKVGFTKDFIVRRIYNYAYGFTNYINDNIDLEKSIVYKTNRLDIEDLILDEFKEYKIDKQTEKLKPECFQDIKDYIKQTSHLNTNQFFMMKQLKSFIPFKDGFEFKEQFKLKINEFKDFKKAYEKRLKTLGLSDKYSPDFYGQLN